LRHPTGVAISPSGAVFVSDSFADMILVFSATGEYLRSFGGRGEEDGFLKYPAGSIFNSEGHYVVVENENKRAQVFTEEGQFLSHFDILVGEETCYPIDITMNHDNNYVILDHGNDRALVTNPEGTTIMMFGENELDGPLSVVVNLNGDMIITDSYQDRIKIFDHTGKFIRCFGEGQLRGPSALLLGQDGIILIADSDRLQFFSLDQDTDTDQPEGRLLKALDRYSYPSSEGLAMTNDGTLVVSDKGHGKILFYCPSPESQDLSPLLVSVDPILTWEEEGDQ